MRRLFKEPLLHFLLLGAALFLVYAWHQKHDRRREPDQIVVTQGQIEQLATGFAKTWQRPPTPDEMASLVRDRVREEVYCREALALGLDQDDVIIRRRLRQKMEFVSDDIAAFVQPTEADLEEYLRSHVDSFRTEPSFTFEQACLDPGKHGDRLDDDVARLLAQLNDAGAGADLSTVGDSRLLETQYAGVTAGEVARQFGAPFALALGRLEPGRWQGPVESGYGVHLVYVRERVEGRLQALSEIRDVVRREWDNARRTTANESFYQQLLGRYTVTIEGVENGTEPVTRASITAR